MHAPWPVSAAAGPGPMPPLPPRPCPASTPTTSSAFSSPVPNANHLTRHAHHAVGGAEGGPRWRVSLRLRVASPSSPAKWSARERWEGLASTEGTAAVSEEAEMVGRLLALLDPLLVRAMMDDEADVALRARAEASAFHPHTIPPQPIHPNTLPP